MCKCKNAIQSKSSNDWNGITNGKQWKIFVPKSPKFKISCICKFFFFLLFVGHYLCWNLNKIDIIVKIQKIYFFFISWAYENKK